MKLLTLTLLLVCMASGQKIVGFDLQKKFGIGELQYHFQGVSDSSNKYLTTVGDDSLYNSAPYSAMVVLTILQYYSLYEKECYADSTFIGRGYWSFDLGNKFWIERETDFLNPEKPAPERWDHRQPTFQGFIEWLRKEVTSSKPTPRQDSRQQK